MQKFLMSVMITIMLGLGYSHASISAIESEKLSPDVDMYLSNFYYDILEEVKAECAATDISLAEQRYVSILPQIKNKFAQVPEYRQLQLTRELHDRYLAKTSGLSKSHMSSYCVLKYLLYNVLDDLRDHHLALMEKNGIMSDFNGFTASGPIAGFDLKKEQLESEVQQYSTYQNLLGTILEFDHIHEDEVATNGQYKTMKDLSSELLQLTVYKVLYDLKQAGVIHQSDVQELKDKIKLEYHLSCANFHGNYRIKETLDHMGSHISFSTVALPLQVNVCGNYFLLGQLAHHYEKIVIHELGHHIYYYNDDESHLFTQICGGSASCLPSDYVTKYASSHPLEDYAETFMYRFLDLPYEKTTVSLKKMNHFDDVF